MSGKLFAIPNLDARDEVMLPPEHVKWFTAEPESVLSIHRVRDVRHSLKHLRIGLDDKAIVHFLTRIVNDSLSKNLDLMHEIMYDEICTAVKGTLAKCDDTWQPFNVYNTVRDINSKVMARLMFGSPICHNEEFLESYHGFMNTIGISVMVIGQLPAILRGLVGPFFSIPLWYFNRRLQKVVLPVVRKRLSRVENPVGDENDVLAQCIKSTLKDEALRKESSAEMLIQQTLGLVLTYVPFFIPVKLTFFSCRLSAPRFRHLPIWRTWSWTWSAAPTFLKSTKSCEWKLRLSSNQRMTGRMQPSLKNWC